MKKKEILHDFGEWNIPERWEEVSLDKFTKLMNNTENGTTDIREIISVMADKSMDEVNLLPVDFVESMMARLTFLNESPKYEAKNEIEVDGTIYKINVLEKLKFGEYVDVNSAIQADKTNYAAFLGILCRKEWEEYNDEYIANTLDERIEMFNSQPITKILPVIAFFLNLYQTSEIYSLDYLTEAKQATNQLLQQIKSSWKNMDFRKRYSILGMKIWWKLRKYKKQISQL